ncbi:MAG: carbohydate-binding domain-containing protein, partial [Bacteroidota bacterium]
MNRYLSLLLCMLLISSCKIESSSSSMKADDYPISWELETNQPFCWASFSLTNNSSDTLKNDWELYYNQSPREVKKVIGPAEIIQLSGDYYKLKPSKDFSLPPGETVSVRYQNEAFLIKETDGPRGVYFLFKGQKDSLQTATNFELQAFTKDDQILRTKNDLVPVPTPEWQYKENEKLSFLEIPEENNVAIFQDSLIIIVEGNYQKEAEYLKKMVQSLSELIVNIVPFDKNSYNKRGKNKTAGIL